MIRPGPGSSIFLFEGLQTVNAGDSAIKSPYVGSKRVFRYLHCGDFRAYVPLNSSASVLSLHSCPKHVLHPAVARARIDTCYLDTTYLNPKYCFPPQPQVIEACAILARKIAVGISPNAPSLEDLKPEIKPFIKSEGGYTDDDGGPGVEVDVKPSFDLAIDRHALEEEREERSKAMMSGWLVKRDSEVDVKVEEGEGKEEVLRELKEEKMKPKGRTLIVMGTYSIGKERIVKGEIHGAFGEEGR
jgi:DNA cross-link repair 1A protein